MIEGVTMQLMQLTGLLWNAVVFLGVLTLVVFVHELGHFLVARWCGVKVTTFSIGFGKELWGFEDSAGTRWRFAAIPIGGYVKFMDDENAASKPSASAEIGPGRGAEGAFHNKPIWQRAAVVAAGPLANFIFAALIYTLLNLSIGVRTVSARIDQVVPGMPADTAGLKSGDVITAIDGWSVEGLEDVARIVGTSGGRTLSIEVDRQGARAAFDVTPAIKEQRDELGVTLKIGDIGIKRNVPATVGEVVADMPAAKAGIRSGDLVTAIDGRAIERFDDIVEIVGGSPGRELKISVLRDGKTLIIPVTPVRIEQKDPQGKPIARGRIGIAPEVPALRSVGLFDSVRLGIKETAGVISQTFDGLRDMVLRRQSLDQVGGPIMMAEVTARVLDHGFEWVLRLMAFFSANIGLLNLLPIPVLDGGHLLFYGIEAIRRRPLSPRAQEIGFRIGMAVVLTLMLFATYNDVVRVGRRWLFGGG